MYSEGGEIKCRIQIISHSYQDAKSHPIVCKSIELNFKWTNIIPNIPQYSSYTSIWKEIWKSGVFYTGTLPTTQYTIHFYALPVILIQSPEIINYKRLS